MLTRHRLLASDNVFLMLMVAMMAALATLACAGALYGHEVRQHWLSGLKGQMTIEIPALEADGSLRSASVMLALSQDMAKSVVLVPAVIKAAPIPAAETFALIEPWLGATGEAADSLHLPRLVSVQLAAGAPAETEAAIKEQMARVDQTARLNTHEDWMADLQRMAGLVSGILASVSLLMLACVTLTVAAAVRSRLLALHTEIGLIHGMGASDGFIARAFLGHILLLVGLASGVGTLLALLLVAFAPTLAASGADGLLWVARLQPWHWGVLGGLPFILLCISGVCALVIVLRSLHKKP